MIYYILDHSSKSSLEERTRSQIVSWLKQHSLAGEFAEAHSPQQMSELALSAAKKDFKTIVAIGNDRSLQATITGCLAVEQDIVVGFIPTQHGSLAADALGLTDWRAAAQNISGRKTRQLKLAQRPHGYFVFEESFETDSEMIPETTIMIDGKLRIKTPLNQIIVRHQTNSLTDTEKAFIVEVYAKNSTAEKTLQSNKSVFSGIAQLAKTKLSPTNELVVRISADHVALSASKNHLLTSTGEKISFPFEISPSGRTIRLIVGKHSPL